MKKTTLVVTDRRFLKITDVIISLRVVKAGTELTWNYSADVRGKQEVTCLCGSGGCQGQFSVEENLCDTCEVDSETR